MATKSKNAGAGCALLVVVGFVIAIIGNCLPEGGTRVGKNGAKGYTPNGPMAYVQLAPGTRLVPDQKVGDRNWRYLVKNGTYQGVYVVVDENDIE